MISAGRNPWLNIPLADYEGHMSLPSIGQAQMLADQFELLIARRSPASVAIFGCAGGNGLERISPGKVRRIVALDINPAYIESVGRRYSACLPGLELLCADAESDAVRFEPVELMYAALLFEYVNIRSTLATLRRNCRPDGMLAVVLQLPNQDHDPVSPSPFKELRALAPMMKLVPPAELEEAAGEIGFAAIDYHTVELPSGKRFRIETFAVS